MWLAMKCPACASNDSLVVDSRPSESIIRRRRRCCKCQHRWSTIEMRADGVKAQSARSVHPVVKAIFELRRRTGMPSYAIEKKSGVSWRTVNKWRQHNGDARMPRIDNVDAVLHVFGFELWLRKKK